MLQGLVQDARQVGTSFTETPTWCNMHISRDTYTGEVNYHDDNEFRMKTR